MDLNENELTPEQRQTFEMLHADFQQQLVRVDVDLRAAFPLMHEVFPPERQDGPGDESSETFTIDLSGILHTLRELPDGAGTQAFVGAYNATHPDWRRPVT